MGIKNFNICHITYGEFPGAGTSTIFEYPIAESAQGLNVCVIAKQFENKPTKVDTLNGVSVTRLSISRSGNELLNQLEFVKEARKIIQQGNFDIIHLYGNVGIMSPLLRLPSTLRQKETVWIRNFRSAPISTREKLFKLHPIELLLRWQSFFFDADFCQSEGTRDRIFGEHRQDIFIARQGANLELFRHTNQNLADLELFDLDDRFILIYIGALTTQRDCKRLLYAMDIALNELDQNIHLLIVGDGNEKSNLQTLASNLGVSRHITFLGQVDYRSVPRYLSIADIGLAYVPDTRVLGAQPPLKTVEMLACDLPVIATDTRGNRHFIQDRFNGLLVQDESSCLAKAIIELVNNESMRSNLSSKARSSVKQYDYANIISSSIIPKYIELIDQKAS